MRGVCTGWLGRLELMCCVGGYVSTQTRIRSRSVRCYAGSLSLSHCILRGVLTMWLSPKCVPRYGVGGKLWCVCCLLIAFTRESRERREKHPCKTRIALIANLPTRTYAVKARTFILMIVPAQRFVSKKVHTGLLQFHICI